MAEFEELRLTVNLVDNASGGLSKLRAEIGQMTQAAASLTTGLNTATTGLVNFGNASQNAAPRIRSVNAQMRELQRSASATGRALGQMGLAARGGMAALPSMAVNLWDATRGVSGMGTALAEIAPAGRIAVLALGGITLAVAAVGAAVIAYGVSVFRFSKEMDQLARTARQMGMSFADLKNAQDQAKAFGGSAEGVIRSFQGIQAAQLDLYKNNSQLRAKLLGQGVDANWINQLATMDPNQARNAIVRYGKALERQALAAGVGANVARAIRNQFGRDVAGFTAEDMEHEFTPVSPEAAEELEEIRVLSKQIQDIWNPLSVKLEKIALEALREGLPYLRDTLSNTDTIIRRVKIEMEGVAKLFRGIADVIAFIKDPWAAVKKWSAEGRDTSHPVLKEFFGGEVTEEYRRKWRSEADKHGTYSIWDKEFWGGGTPSEQFLRNKGLQFDDPVVQKQSYSGGRGGGGYGSNPLLIRASYSMEESAEETGRATGQLERLNNFFDRMEDGGIGRGGSGGAGGAGGPMGLGGGGYGGGGRHGGASTGGYGAGGPAGLVDQDGKGIDPETMKQVEVLGRAGDTAGLQKLFAAKGYRMSGPACGIVAGKYVMSAGFQGPKGGAIASNWNDWGQAQAKEDINNPNRPFGSMIASYSERRYGGNIGAPLGKGQTGGHVMTIVPGSYDAKTNTAMFADQYGVRRRSIRNMDLRYAGDTAVAEVRAKRAAGGNVAMGDRAGDAKVAGAVVGGDSSDENPGAAPAGATPRQSAEAFLKSRGLGINQVPIGMTVNNPGNLKFTGSQFQLTNFPGISKSHTRDQGDPQAAFTTPQAGMNAAATLAVRKFNQGMTTVGQIIAGQGGWTPGHRKAAEAIAKTLGVGVNDQLNLRDPAQLSNFLNALVIQEHGGAYKDVYPKQMKDTAAAAALRLPPPAVAAPAPATAPAPAAPTAGNRGAFRGDRAELDRGALTDAQKIETEGKLKAQVTAPTGTKVEVEGSGAFKETETTKSTKVAETVSI